MIHQHILITGATSGIGLGILKTYEAMGWQVTAINRRRDPALEQKYPHVRFHHFDVRETEAVKKYFEQAASAKELPCVYFLSAGINKVDNLDGFNLGVFRDVMETNLIGVFNFIHFALPHLKGQKSVFVAASSTTNIFPNPNCLGYCASKLSLYKTFQILDKIYRPQGIRFKTLVLGPIATNILVSGQLGSKLQAAVRDFITVSVEKAVGPIVRFVHSNSQTFFYPKISCLLFYALKIANSMLPGFYKGSAPPSTPP